MEIDPDRLPYLGILGLFKKKLSGRIMQKLHSLCGNIIEKLVREIYPEIIIYYSFGKIFETVRMLLPDNLTKMAHREYSPANA